MPLAQCGIFRYMDESKEQNAIREAARDLRAHLGRTQQAMAGDLGLSMGALRNYERGTVATPEPRPLYAYMMAAELSQRPDLAAIFRSALYKVLEISDSSDGILSIEPRDDFERVLIAAMLSSIRGAGPFAKFQGPVFSALVKPCKLLNQALPRITLTWQTFSDAAAKFAACPTQFKLVRISGDPRQPLHGSTVRPPKENKR
jgi:transcriptional regulator with XRE-family HTH domain